jgi:hypothetical protein
MTERDESFRCRDCDFLLLGRWSCPTVAYQCICIECATIFSIECFESIEGRISEGDICHLYQPINRKKNRKKYLGRPTQFDTGVRVSVVSSIEEIMLADRQTSLRENLTFDFENTQCPSCLTPGSLRISLKSGDKCPSCKTGIIENSSWF